jgi:hypothetical protein
MKIERKICGGDELDDLRVIFWRNFSNLNIINKIKIMTVFGNFVEKDLDLV